MWLERYVLVVPSVWRPASLPLGILELCLLAGFFDSYALTFLRSYGPLFRLRTA